MLNILFIIIKSCLWTMLYVIAAVQSGGILLRVFSPVRMEQKPHIKSFNLSFLLGLSVLSVIWMILGLTAAFKVQLIAGILLFSFVIAVFRVIKASREHRINPFKNFRIQFRTLPLVWLVISVILLLIITGYALFSLLLPVTGDAEAFYMTIAKVITYSGKIVPLINYHDFSMIGLFGELHYAALLSVSGLMAAKFLIWFVYLSIASSIYSLCVLSGQSIKGKMIAQILLITSTTVSLYLTSGKVDLFAAALGLGVFFLLLEKTDSWTVKESALVGLLLGFSVLSKLSYIPVMYPGVALAILVSHFRGEKGHTIKRIKNAVFWSLIVFLFSLTAFLPHVIKNYIIFNEPLAPFIYIHKEASSSILQQVWFNAEATKYIVLTYPFQLFFGRFPMQGGVLSPLILAFIPLGLLGKIKKIDFKRPEFVMLFISLSAIIVWVVLRPSVLAPRYILAPLLLLIPVAGSSVDKYFKDVKSRVSHTIVFVALFTVLAVFGIESNFPGNLLRSLRPVIQGKASVSRYGEGINILNEKVTSGERVFVAGYYTYYLQPEILLNMNNEKETAEFNKIKDNPAEFFIEHNFKYIYIQKNSGYVFNYDIKIIPGRVIFEDEYSIVYSINY